jgi:LPXTG-motif cell wall-anchored protein
VAVGVIVGVGLIAGAIWFLVRRRKKGASFQSVPAPDADDSEKGGAALPKNGPSPTESPGMAMGNISRKPVSPPPQEQERDIPMLDSGDVHEAPAMPAGGERDTTQVFELDAGPIYGMHQQAIHHE